MAKFLYRTCDKSATNCQFVWQESDM